MSQPTSLTICSYARNMSVGSRGSAPALSRALILSTQPIRAAQCRALSPSSSVKSSFAPAGCNAYIYYYLYDVLIYFNKTHEHMNVTGMHDVCVIVIFKKIFICLVWT